MKKLRLTNHTLRSFLSLALISSLMSCSAKAIESEKLIADFKDSGMAQSKWKTVNDNVMGGRSKGGPSFSNQLLVFSGSTNTKGGGFSSIRTKPAEVDLSPYRGMLMRVKGDGRSYTTSVRTDHVGDWSFKTAFRAKLDLPKDEWTVVFVPFENYKPTLFGDIITKNPPPMEPSKICSVGFHIYDKKDGAFRLEVDWIKAVSHMPKSLTSK